MGWAKLPDGRSILPSGTILDLRQGGGHYKIVGEPVGYGGSGIIYPAVRVTRIAQTAGTVQGTGTAQAAGTQGAGMAQGQKDRDSWQEDEMRVAVKECFPLVQGAALERKENGEILGQGEALYDHARRMLQKERSITAQIYNKGFRLIPLWNVAEEEWISLDGGEHFAHAENLYGIMERLDEKGVSLGRVLREKESGRTHFRAYTGIVLICQVLRALKEVHENGFLHGDIQENNIFLKGGDLEEPDQGEVSLIDFGAARPLLEDGATEAIVDRSLYTTNGYTAPECLQGNDGTLRLTRAADIYSVGYLLLRMLTGKAMDPRALQLVVNGKYIYGRQAKRIGCPSSALEALNKVLKRALAPDPADRYQTAEEMLEDTNRLERALAPKNSAIAAVDYAAFISYCHEEKSMEAAEQIQRTIEGYKIPRPLRAEKGQKRLGKVFRDREELSSSGDMEAHIKEALAHSAFLIVLLCPDTPRSVWVDREVELFLKDHSREHVLTVVVEGDPRETLPEHLRKDEKEDKGGIRLQPVEGLAADIRGADRKERKKKLKTEIYRLLAPMLGCGYDDLRQRQREYQLRKAVKTMTAALVVLGLVAGYIGWQAYQIHENYWETMIQRSRYLAQTSGQLLKEGDRMAAIAVALEALPDGEDDHSRPYVGEAEAALSQALYSYRSAQTVAYFLSGDRILSMDVRSKGMDRVSPEGKRLLAVDERDTIYIWDIESGICERKWDASFLQEHQLAGEIRYGDFLDEDRVFFLIGDQLVRIHIQEQRIELCQDLGYGEGYWTSRSVCGADEGKEFLAIYCENVYISLEELQDRSLAVYRLSDGEMVCSVPVETETDGWRPFLSVGEMAFSQDGRYLAVPLYPTYGASDEEGAVLGALLTVDLEDGSYALTRDLQNGYSQALFLDNGDIALFGYEDDILGLNREVSMSGGIGCYDPKAGKPRWEIPILCQKKSGQASGLLHRTLQIEGGEKEIVLLWCGRDIRFFDAGTGREVWKYSCEKGLVGIQPRQQRMIIGTEDGSLSMLYPDEQWVVLLGTGVERKTDRFLFDEQTDTAFLSTLEDGGGKIAVLKRIEDLDRESVALKGRAVYFTTCADNGTYMICTKDGEDVGEITFYDGSSHKEKASVPVEGWLSDNIWLPGERAIFCYHESYAGENQKIDRIVAFDVEKQGICWQIETDELILGLAFFCVGEESRAIINYGSRIEELDLEDGTIKSRIEVTDKEADWTERGAKEVRISPSGRYILMITERYSEEQGQYESTLHILDRKEDREVPLPKEITDLGAASSLSKILEPAQKKDLAAIYIEEANELRILDLETMEITHRIPFQAFDHRKIAFTPDDRWILLWGNDLRLKLWDLENDCIKMEDTQELYQVAGIDIEEGSPFIVIEGVDAAHQSYSYGVLNDDHLLYRWEEEGKFYPYADLLMGIYVAKEDRIICMDTAKNILYRYDRHTLDELLEKAREVLGDYTLDDTARMRYLMEE